MCLIYAVRNFKPTKYSWRCLFHPLRVKKIHMMTFLFLCGVVIFFSSLYPMDWICCMFLFTIISWGQVYMSGCVPSFNPFCNLPFLNDFFSLYLCSHNIFNAFLSLKLFLCYHHISNVFSPFNLFSICSSDLWLVSFILCPLPPPPDPSLVFFCSCCCQDLAQCSPCEYFPPIAKHFPGSCIDDWNRQIPGFCQFMPQYMTSHIFCRR